MRSAGVTETERIKIRRVTEPGCKPNHVCSTYPEAMRRSGQSSDKALSVGKDPNAVVKAEEKKPETNSKPADEETDDANDEKAEDFF